MVYTREYSIVEMYISYLVAKHGAYMAGLMFAVLFSGVLVAHTSN